MECLDQIWINVTPSLKTTKVKGTVEYGSRRAQQVDCGKCAYCLINKRNSWVFRIYQEMKYQNHRGWFLTFTYNEKFIEKTEDGNSLRFRDVQLYLKRLRKAGYYCKYVCVGEYGTKTRRPHYHIILWSDAPPEFLESNWKIEWKKEWYLLGNVHFGTLTPASAMYAMKYIIQPKKAYGKLEKPRAQFSKGIGLDYLSCRMYDFLTSNYEDPDPIARIDGKPFGVPKYYKEKIYTRYQKKIISNKTIERRNRERKEKELALISRGVINPAEEIRKQRIENALRIMKKQKVNELL